MMNWNALYDRLRAGIPALELRRDEPMARHTTFQVGGPVPVMALPKDEGEAQTVLHIAAMEFGIRPFFMGKGSNLLVSDAGADLLVVKAYDGLGRLELLPGGEWPGYQTILAGSGVSLARLSNFALEHGLTGLEFAYRHSRFQEQDEFILRACFTLKPGNPAEIRAKMDDFAQRRREKQPLEYPSAGSTFKRPAPADGRPVYAAALIDQCGLKGLAVGGAQVSEKHAGFVINRGGASCRDILELIAQVRERVFRETGITLEPEVRCLGREGEGWNF